MFILKSHLREFFEFERGEREFFEFEREKFKKKGDTKVGKDYYSFKHFGPEESKSCHLSPCFVKSSFGIEILNFFKIK